MSRSTVTPLGDPGTRAALELAALALIAAACLLNLYVPSGTERTLGTLLAALVVPGAALMTRLALADAVQCAALVVGTSLTAEVAVTLGMAWAGWWQPVAAAAVLAGGTAVVLAADLVRYVRPSTQEQAG
jgi:hypothetical protein